MPLPGTAARTLSAGGLQVLARAARRCREAVAAPLLEAVFPARCVCCGEFETFLCSACEATLRPVGRDRCPRCGHPGFAVSGPGWCPMCVGQEPTFSSARSVFFHEGAARRLVTNFKYDGLRALGRTMSALAAEAFQDLLEEVGPAVVTWVPSHASNTRARGYNQAEVLARELARACGDVPVAALTSKVRRTGHQRELSREGRSRNLKGAFIAGSAVERGVRRHGLHPDATQTDPIGRGRTAPNGGAEGVVLVDDVYTTGATVAEVSRVLVDSWRVPVHVFTFSRTPSDLPQRAD